MKEGAGEDGGTAGIRATCSTGLALRASLRDLLANEGVGPDLRGAFVVYCCRIIGR